VALSATRREDAMAQQADVVADVHSVAARESLKVRFWDGPIQCATQSRRRLIRQ